MASDPEIKLSRKGVVQWLAGIASAVIIALTLGFATWLTSMHHQLAAFEVRITVLEKQGASQDQRLEKIEQKLDRVIELMQRRVAAGGN